MYKSTVTLTNNTGSNISIGNVILYPGQPRIIWSLCQQCSRYFLEQIISNISSFNQHIQNGDIIVNEDSFNRSVLSAFSVLDKMLTGYKTFLTAAEYIDNYNNINSKIPKPDGYTQIWWTMDSSSQGLKNQGFGGELDLTLNAGNDSVAEAPMGQCRVFDRTLCFKTVQTTIGESSGDLTISFWANFYKLYDAVVVVKMYYGNDNWGDTYMTAGIYEDTYDSAGSRMRLWVVPNSGGTTQISGINSDIEQGWHLYSFVFNSSTGVLQQVIDGCVTAQQTLATGSLDWWTHGRWVVGGNINNSANIRGKLCHIRVKNTARSLQYLKDMCKQGLS